MASVIVAVIGITFIVPALLGFMVMAVLAMSDEDRRYSVAGYRRDLHYSPPGKLARGKRALTAPACSV